MSRQNERVVEIPLRGILVERGDGVYEFRAEVPEVVEIEDATYLVKQAKREPICLQCRTVVNKCPNCGHEVWLSARHVVLELYRLPSEIADRLRRVSELEAQLAQALEQISRLQARIAELEAQLEKLRSEKESAEEYAKKLEEDYNRLKTEYEKLKREHEELRHRLEEVKKATSRTTTSAQPKPSQTKITEHMSGTQSKPEAKPDSKVSESELRKMQMYGEVETLLKRLEEELVVYVPDKELQQRVIEAAKQRGMEVVVEQDIFLKLVKKVSEKE